MVDGAALGFLAARSCRPPVAVAADVAAGRPSSLVVPGTEVLPRRSRRLWPARLWRARRGAAVVPSSSLSSLIVLERGVSVNDDGVEIARLLILLPNQDERENAGTVRVKH